MGGLIDIEQKGCESIIHDHDRDLWVTIIIIIIMIIFDCNGGVHMFGTHNANLDGRLFWIS